MLRHKITIQRKVSQADGAGGVILTWTDIRTLRAKAIPAGGSGTAGISNETVRAGRLRSKVAYVFIIRWVSGFRVDDRILFDGRFFNIQSIINMDERSLWGSMSAFEGVAQ